VGGNRQHGSAVKRRRHGHCRVVARVLGSVTVQGPVPEQPPLHPANEEPDAGTAFKVTDVPASNRFECVRIERLTV